MQIQVTGSDYSGTVSWHVGLFVDSSTNEPGWVAQRSIHSRGTRQTWWSDPEWVDDGHEFANQRLVELADDGYKVSKTLWED